MTIELQLQEIQRHAAAGNVQFTQHARVEIGADGVSVSALLEAICSEKAEIVEAYPEHKRGACCLLVGWTGGGRPLHVVRTTARPVLIITTVYEPKPPKRITPTKRGETPCVAAASKVAQGPTKIARSPTPSATKVRSW